MSTNGSNPHAPDHCVRVRGARENNLRDVDVAIPRNALAVFTGVSGSGKSSLAFGTIYAEAQRRYFESVAPYARRLLQQTGAPKVDDIDGPAAGRRAAAAPRRDELALLGGHGHDALEPAAHAVLARRPLPARRDRGHGLGLVQSRTRRSARARSATGSGRSTGSPRRRSSPTRRSASASARWRRGRAPGRGRTCATSSSCSASTSTGRGASSPKRDREWILFTDEQPTVFIDPDEHPTDADYTYNGTFSSAERHVMHTLANSQSAAMRQRALRFVETRRLPGLRRDGPAARGAGGDVRRAHDRRAGRAAADRARGGAAADRRARGPRRRVPVAGVGRDAPRSR